MNDYGGLIFAYKEPKLAEELQRRITTDGYFTRTISRPDWNPEQREVCFISFDSINLSHAALLTRRVNNATVEVRVKITNFVPLNNITFERIQSDIGKQAGWNFSWTANTKLGGARIPSHAWAYLIRYIKTVQPNIADALDNLETLRLAPPVKLDSSAYRCIV
jgi:hypothetical protein